jgi:hypothetical protein
MQAVNYNQFESVALSARPQHVETAEPEALTKGAENGREGKAPQAV